MFHPLYGLRRWMSYQWNIFSSARFVQVFEHTGKVNRMEFLSGQMAQGWGCVSRQNQTARCGSVAQLLRLVYYRLTLGGRFIWNKKIECSSFYVYITKQNWLLSYCSVKRANTLIRNQNFTQIISISSLSLSVCVYMYASLYMLTKARGQPQATALRCQGLSLS